MQTQLHEYHDGDTVLEGYLAYEPSRGNNQATVIVAHDWSGRNEFAEQKAKWLCELGYVGFALDMYGKGQRGTNNDEKNGVNAAFDGGPPTIVTTYICSLQYCL